MKLYGSDASVNGSGPTIDDDEQDEEFAGSERDFSDLFKAPNYADFIRLKPNSRAKTYERKTASLLKAGLVASLNAEQLPDAATFLKHGPGVATAAGNLAAEDPRAAKLIDMLTAPESPYVMFALAVLPMVSQLVRNHETEVRDASRTWRERRQQQKQEKKAGFKTQAPPLTVTIPLLKRQIKLPIRLKVKLPKLRNLFTPFMTPTQHPSDITYEVFRDPAVLKALHAMGVRPEGGSHEEDA